MENILCSLIAKIIFIYILFKRFTGSIQFLSKFQWHFSQKYKTIKICMKPQSTLNSKINIKKEETSCFLIKLLQCDRIKRVWYQYNSKHTDEWNRAESPEINPCICVKLFYNERAKNMQWGKGSLLKTRCWDNWTATSKRINLNT